MRPTADELIAKEIARQDEMWGKSNERADVSHGELMRAGMAQLGALLARQVGGKNAFETAPGIYPADWHGFRDYGSDIANLVVAVAFLRQEIKRKLNADESFERTSRKPGQVPPGWPDMPENK
jgi:hypothetical protein